MTVYVRADVASVSVPETSGGCGKPHSRPVVDGVAVYRDEDGNLAPWPIVCPRCETDLKQDILRSGGRKVRTQNLDAGMKLADRFLGLYGSTVDTIPETPDQERHREAEELKKVTEHSKRQAQSAEDTAASMNSIAAAIAGNSDLMTKFMEFQMALVANHQPVVQGTAEPEIPPGYAEVSGSLYTCQDCGEQHLRSSNKGPAPKRCPDCKAKAAA